MIVEHFAINVKDPNVMTERYVSYLQTNVISEQAETSYIAFFSDSSGRVFLELYNDSNAQIPYSWKLQLFEMHIPFAVPSLPETTKKLLSVGARHEYKRQDDSGSLCIMRGSWGGSFQFIQRKLKCRMIPEQN